MQIPVFWSWRDAKLYHLCREMAEGVEDEKVRKHTFRRIEEKDFRETRN